MEDIPQKRRVSLLLHLAHDYTVSEVAELTNVSPNTVKDRLRTAYKELRAILEGNPDLQSGILEEIS
jgi:DNA-directed RNA polymerase specialized sigma24 family protein